MTNRTSFSRFIRSRPNSSASEVSGGRTTDHVDVLVIFEITYFMAGIIGTDVKISRMANAAANVFVGSPEISAVYSSARPRGFMFAVALIQPAPPISTARARNASLDGKTSNPSGPKVRIIDSVFAQSPEESFAPRTTPG